jgi:DNA-binding response OmpR family regulator
MVERNIGVLLVEDNPGDARLIQELLSHANRASFQIEVAERLSDGLEALSARRFDVVLLSIPPGQLRT